MVFTRIKPSASIKHFIDCYWMVDDEDMTVKIQKIIPDGFPEIIFHYADPYKIQIEKSWALQSNFLLAGQITKYFYLANSGRTGSFGIKFKPAALSQLFNLSMKEYTDKVVSLDHHDHPDLKSIKSILAAGRDYGRIIVQLNSFFEQLIKSLHPVVTAIDNAVNVIFERHGMVSVSELSDACCIGERQLLNLFRRYIGLSPKLYARVIRLSFIFHLVQKNKEKWTSRAYEAAFFDQAHFIKDFKKFTGVNPGKYAFEEKNMANFFLMKNEKNLPDHYNQS